MKGCPSAGVGRHAVSVVIPTHDRRDSLARCIRSVYAQDNGLVREVIIVDDGSGDGTAKYLQDAAQRYPDLRYVRQGHAGPSAARNAGIRMAKSPYVLFIDDDCTLAKGFMEELSAILGGCAEVVHAHCLDPYTDNYYNAVWQLKHEVYVRSCPLVREGVRKVKMLADCYAVKRSVFDRIGLFDESFVTNEDTDMVRRMRERKIPILHYETLRINHYSRTGAWGTLKKFFWYGVGCCRFERKYGVLPDFLQKREGSDSLVSAMGARGLDMRRVRMVLMVEAVGLHAGLMYAYLGSGRLLGSCRMLARILSEAAKGLALYILGG